MTKQRTAASIGERTQRTTMHAGSVRPGNNKASMASGPAQSDYAKRARAWLPERELRLHVPGVLDATIVTSTMGSGIEIQSHRPVNELDGLKGELEAAGWPTRMRRVWSEGDE